ncbi:MAG: Rpn family recombination-promoting nuclease/putative transposase [Silvanigrellaceae bacterium]|nr:Rpn family recombination-promoting nuclease/putative transposase [Silvanigrellaceae bacterium]
MTFLNLEINKDILDGKDCKLDVLAEMDDATRINIEVQIAPQIFFAKRSLFYWGKIYTEQLGNGQPYTDLKRCVCINLLSFKLFPEFQEYHSFGRFIDLKNRRLVTFS